MQTLDRLHPLTVRDLLGGPVADCNPIKFSIIKDHYPLAPERAHQQWLWTRNVHFCYIEDSDGESLLVLRHSDGSVVGPEIARYAIAHLVHAYNRITEEQIEESYDHGRVEPRHVIEPTEYKDWRGYIYLMAQQMPGADPIYKIGRTEGKHPQHRLKTLQLASGTPIALIAFAYVWNIKTEEKFLHKRFAAKRTLGEWFALDSDDVGFVVAHLEAKALPSSDKAA